MIHAQVFECTQYPRGVCDLCIQEEDRLKTVQKPVRSRVHLMFCEHSASCGGLFQTLQGYLAHKKTPTP